MGQTLRIVADLSNIRFFQQGMCSSLSCKSKQHLIHSLLLPLAIFTNKKVEVQYLTAIKILEVICNVAQIAHLDLSEEELLSFFAQSIRVETYAPEQSKEKRPDYIKA